MQHLSLQQHATNAVKTKNMIDGQMDKQTERNTRTSMLSARCGKHKLADKHKQ